MRQAIEDNAQYLETYIIPRTPDEEPGYKSGRVAEFVLPRRGDLEVTEAEPATGAPFLAENGAKP